MENLVKFGGAMTAHINFAMQQNYVPIFRSIIVTNISDSTLKNVFLRIAFEPDFAEEYESAPMDLQPDVPVEISPVDIKLRPDYLFGLTEKIAGYVRIEAISRSAEGETVIGRELRDLELLAYDQWTGVNFMPETAAAFITPNHPAVQGVLSKASLFLQKWCGDPAFTGYQTKNPNIVKQQMGAVYAALQQENIAYTVPPASFEEAQRIRLPDSVLEGKCGTCIDLAVLYCACLEAAGLNSLLVITATHAMAGCWLEEETFSDSLQYDSSALTKRMSSGVDEISVIECTDFTAGKSVDFDTAESHAADKLAKSADLCFAIDVARTRTGGIRPIPARVAENGTFTAVDYGARSENEITAAPGEIAVNDLDINGQPREVTKQMMWERKLLDLSLRNSLLNFRPTASNVQLMVDSLAALEDRIAADETFKIMPMPNDMTLEVSDSKIYENENQRELIADIAAKEFQSKRLRTYISESELEKTMKKLHRLAKVSLEENGVNTIYLALGFLRWYETDKSEKPRYAPLVLVPVDIIKKVQDKSFSIRIRDEDTQVNITLLEMLRQFFGLDIQGLDPVPEDDSGVDIPLIFSIIRKGVMSRSRWDIEEYAFIGQFSFNRFIMWNDIRNRTDELAQNKVVASLISGKTEWEGSDLAVSPVELDGIAPSDLAVPVAADSSQLAAVVASGQGQSFVLHGPPGTGKSQTITNMIANALYHGRSVLFVAEKMAALSVVEKRLDKIGLGPFCIELHSNKAQKRAVLDQLNETLNVGRIKKPADHQAQADKLRSLRAELNGTMEEIHKVRNYGISLYDAAVHYEQCRAFEGKLDFTSQQVTAMTADTYSQWKELVESLANLGSQFGDVSSTALTLCRLTECSLSTGDEFRNKLNELESALDELEKNEGSLSAMVGGGELTYAQLSALAEICKAASAGEGFVLSAVLNGNKWDMLSSAVQKTMTSLEGLHSSKAELSAVFEDSVFSYDVQKASTEWKSVQAKWFIPKHFGSKRLVKELAVHGKNAGAVTKENIADHYQKLIKAADLKADTESGQAAMQEVFGALWQGEGSEPKSLKASLDKSLALRERLASSPFETSQRTALGTKLGEGTLPAYKNDDLTKVLKDLESTFRTDTVKLTAGSISDIRERLSALSSEIPRLKDWTVLMGFCEKLEQAGAANIPEAYLGGKVDSSELSAAFDCSLSKAEVTTAMNGSKVLSGFTGTLFEDTVRRLNDVHESFKKLTIQELAAELSAKVPAPGESAKSSELGILQRAIKSGGRMMSIRKLFDSIPNLLRRLCPVMLMSPISVAQYIDPSYPKFDLVIFDEASQLPTCEAVGAIARGENVIVVGDPKQMPPTSFFSTNQVDEENYDKEDLESVLDDCLALSMPQKHLLWHYRSRHESLIAYSNSKYYENKLYTFPSPDDQISEVSWVHVEGFYDKGSTKTNRAEAEAVVEEICRRLRDPQLRKHSIGVVTFSLPQQNLVDDVLSDAFRAEPQLEVWANEMYEPILIKNLENVQGDERDVIFFSIGYGPDKEGKVSMNFGPLNRDGGWRRLNVAISRAREKMVVYSVITPEMIDLSRTRSEGVDGLKGFLEFAAKGRAALPVRAGSSKAGTGFERLVADELEKQGYTVRCSVGCSDHKVDVAVADPENTDTYILGISCCGKNWYENGTAYDRSISQPSVLKGLGWNVICVYLLDWLTAKERYVQNIITEIDKAIEAKHAPAPAAEEAPKKAEPLEFEREEQSALADECDEYAPFIPKVQGTSDQFNEASLKKITACIDSILEAEAPVSREVLQKRVQTAWGVARQTNASKAAFEAALGSSEGKSVMSGETEFIWLKEQDPDTYDKCRAKCAPEIRRDIKDIPAEELGNGVILIMSRQIAMQRDDLLRETARLFGFTRLTPAVETAVSLGIRAAKFKGRIAFGEDGKVSYIE
ncbi:DUF3320 domain-containing protein [Ruminococcus sp.]|uniref:DUF3320 domain-containing protein n=1 Tax=Ruminococcus sp. TaxID=41978 RepID=UPI0025DE6B36|nr:DUF3320 domain-containing protein [Ruminococcus sp.]MBQ8967458.1 DUF3320 domain-containing protein [Ruminococcus sp.]